MRQVRLCDARGAKLIDSSDLIEKMEAAMKEEGHGNARSSRACHTIVFVNRKRDAEMVAEYIERNVEGVRAESLHGDLLQARCSREAAEMQPRYTREAAEVQPRRSRGAAEVQSRCIRDAREMQPRCSR